MKDEEVSLREKLIVTLPAFGIAIVIFFFIYYFVDPIPHYFWNIWLSLKS